MGRLQYTTIKEAFASKGCRLLTTEEEYVEGNFNAKSNYKITSQCGHETIVKYDMFKAKSTGVNCKNCIFESFRQRKLESRSEETEYTGYVRIRDALIKDNKLVISKMVEGTKADFSVKPIGEPTDNWLPVQLKVTESPSLVNSNNYSFRKVGNGYDGMLVLCFCIATERIWLLPSEVVKGLSTLSIGAKTSKYQPYEIALSELSNKLMEFYYIDAICEKNTKAKFNIPVSEQQRREQEYRRVREDAFPSLSFQYPEQEKLCYDFIVNGLKVQEKVATRVRKRGKLVEGSFIVNLMSHRAYKYGENDFYWVNIPGKEMFYLIPESELHSNGFLDNPRHKQLPFYPGKDKPEIKHKWVENYCFRYDRIPKTVFDMLKCDNFNR